MRMMMRFTIPVDRGNNAGGAETERVFKSVMELLKPEAAYFMLEDGQRAGMFFFEGHDSVTMVRAHEMLFKSLNASVWTKPVVTSEELARSLAASG